MEFDPFGKYFNSFAVYFDSVSGYVPKYQGDFLIPMVREWTLLECKNPGCGWWAIRLYTIYTEVHYHDIASDHFITNSVVHIHKQFPVANLSWYDLVTKEECWNSLEIKRHSLTKKQAVLFFGMEEVRSKSIFHNSRSTFKVDYWRNHRLD